MRTSSWSLSDDEAAAREPAGVEQARLTELCCRAIRAVRGLPRPMRRVFLLRWRRHGYVDIAAQLGIGQATARKYYAEARRLVTAAILAASALLVAFVPFHPGSTVTPVRPTTIAPSAIAASDAFVVVGGEVRNVAELEVEQAEALLDSLLR